MIRFRMVSLLMLAVGVLFLLGGVGGFASLCIASQNYEHTTGVIRKYQTKRVHRFRKIRYKSEMLIGYPTPKYGEMFVSRASYWPFRSEGDRLPVWYHPEHPRDIRLPNSECLLWGFLTVSGLIVIYVGTRLRKEQYDEKTDD